MHMGDTANDSPEAMQQVGEIPFAAVLAVAGPLISVCESPEADERSKEAEQQTQLVDKV